MVTKAQMESLLRQADPVPDNLYDEASPALLASILERRDEMTRTDVPISAPTPAPGPQPTRRRARAFAMSAVIAVAAIGAIALLVAGPDSDEATAGGATATFAPSPRPDGSWSRMAIEPGFEPGQIRVTSFGLIAAGQTDGVWMSEDGTNWRQALVGPYEPYEGTTTTPVPPLTVPPPSPDVWSSVTRVAEFDSTLYAVGLVGREQVSRIVVWSSDDGTSWQETVVEELEPGTEGLFVATLISTRNLLVGYEQFGSRVLYTEDGETWTILDSAETGLEGVGVSDVIAFGDLYLAIGETYPVADPNHNGIRAVYSSTDGLHFQKAPGSDFAASLFPRSLTQHEGTLFLGGFELLDGEMVPALWRSPDGSTWNRIPLPLAAESGDSSVDELIPTEDGVIVVVAKRDWGETARLTVYQTTDGTVLTPIPAESGALEQLADVEGTVFEGRLILIGREYCSLECDPLRPVIQATWAPAD